MHRQRIWMWVFGILTIISFFLPWLSFAGRTANAWEFSASHVLPVMVIISLVLASIDNRAHSIGYIQLIISSFCILVVAVYAGYNIYQFIAFMREFRGEEAVAMIRIRSGAYATLICSLLFLVGAWGFRDPNNEQARARWHRSDILDDL